MSQLKAEKQVVFGASAWSTLSEYNCWRMMINRCTRPANPKYPRYGGRGITVCDRWLRSFPAFAADMGPRPGPDYSIDRINNDGNYEPENCRWANRAQQQHNSSQTKITIAQAGEIRRRYAAGERRQLLAEEYGICSTHVGRIINFKKWLPERREAENA